MILRNTAPKRRWLSLVYLMGAMALASALIGCASGGSSNSVGNNTPEGLYGIAKRALDRGDFLTATDVYESLGAQFPFGPFTQRAQLEVTYAYFKQDEYDNAIAAADRYIKLYPRDPSVDYAPVSYTHLTLPTILLV